LKTRPTIALLITALFLLGCSKESGPTKASAKGIVPATGEEIVASPDFKLEHTTKSGIKCYTRAVSPEVFRSIQSGTPDRKYLTGSEQAGFLLVPIRDGTIADLSTEESHEVAGFFLKKMLPPPKESQDMLKKTPGYRTSKTLAATAVGCEHGRC
jgi:hypothetical protein